MFKKNPKITTIFSINKLRPLISIRSKKSSETKKYKANLRRFVSFKNKAKFIRLKATNICSNFGLVTKILEAKPNPLWPLFLIKFWFSAKSRTLAVSLLKTADENNWKDFLVFCKKFENKKSEFSNQ